MISPKEPIQFSPVAAYNTSGLDFDWPNHEIAMLSMSLLMLVQVVPPSVVFHTPPPTLPAIQVFLVASPASTIKALVLPGALNGPLSIKVALS